MITDNVRNRSTYYGLGSRLTSALEFISRISPESTTEGRVDISGSDLFATFDHYQTHGIEGGSFESHRTYVDVQYVIEGRETIRVRDVSELELTTPYDSRKDIAFYEKADGTDVRLFAGDFVVLFPQDAHVPQLHCDGAATVRKVVVKVRI